jgi:hypothetical protein
MVRQPACSGAAALLERGGELARIDELIAASVEGEGHVLVIEGRSGVGKSALLAELRSRAGRPGWPSAPPAAASWRGSSRSASSGSCSRRRSEPAGRRNRVLACSRAPPRWQRRCWVHRPGEERRAVRRAARSVLAGGKPGRARSPPARAGRRPLGGRALAPLAELSADPPGGPSHPAVPDQPAGWHRRAGRAPRRGRRRPRPWTSSSWDRCGRPR